MSNTAPSRADPVVVFPLGRWWPPQETSQPPSKSKPHSVMIWSDNLWHDSRNIIQNCSEKKIIQCLWNYSAHKSIHHLPGDNTSPSITLHFMDGGTLHNIHQFESFVPSSNEYHWKHHSNHINVLGKRKWKNESFSDDTHELRHRPNCWFLFNTLRPRQDGCHFPDDISKCIFLNENVKNFDQYFTEVCS